MKTVLRSVTTDVLVGFPGEKRDNFDNTTKLLKKIKPLKIHIFPYSRREGTAAAGFNNGVSPQELKRRVLELKELGMHLTKSYMNTFNNKEKPVLIESRVKDKPGFWEGFTDNYMRVIIRSDSNFKNCLIPLKLKRLTQEYFLADP